MKLSCTCTLFMGALFLFAAACKKDNGSGNAPAKEPRITSFSDNYQSSNESYTYDNNDRLLSYKYDSGTVRYTYSDTAVREDYYNNAGVFSGSDYYKLNSRGLAGSIDLINGLIRQTYQYEYNADGYITKRKYVYVSGYTKWYFGWESRYYRTNNLVDSMDFINNTIDSLGNTLQGTLSERDYFSFYSDKKMTIDNPNFGQAFMGRLYTSPLKTIVRVFSGNNFGDTTQYSYMYDAKQNITQQVVAQQGQAPTTYYYKYR